jgi:hypothetical protein
MPVALPSPPSAATLRGYGLTSADWYAMCRRQGCVCPVCRQPFGDRKLVVDHEHVKGWKKRKPKKMAGGKVRAKSDPTSRVMTPAERRPHVRGVLHAWCNGLVRVWLTLERAESIRDYLEAHRARRQAEV